MNIYKNNYKKINYKTILGSDYTFYFIGLFFYTITFKIKKND